MLHYTQHQAMQYIHLKSERYYSSFSNLFQMEFSVSGFLTNSIYFALTGQEILSE